jgi:hypothetical protein
MNTKLIIPAIALCLFVAFAATMLKQHPSPVSVPFATNMATAVNGKTNAVGEEGYFKTIIDPQTGRYAIANASKEFVSLRDKNGNIIWSINLVDDLRKEPEMSGVTINSLELSGDKIVVRVDRCWFILDSKTGKITGGGSN